MTRQQGSYSGCEILFVESKAFSSPFKSERECHVRSLNEGWTVDGGRKGTERVP
jgi:hypothetical protein